MVARITYVLFNALFMCLILIQFNRVCTAGNKLFTATTGGMISRTMSCGVILIGVVLEYDIRVPRQGPLHLFTVSNIPKRANPYVIARVMMLMD